MINNKILRKHQTIRFLKWLIIFAGCFLWIGNHKCKEITSINEVNQLNVGVSVKVEVDKLYETGVAETSKTIIHNLNENTEKLETEKLKLVYLHAILEDGLLVVRVPASKYENGDYNKPVVIRGKLDRVSRLTDVYGKLADRYKNNNGVYPNEVFGTADNDPFVGDNNGIASFTLKTDKSLGFNSYTLKFVCILMFLIILGIKELREVFGIELVENEIIEIIEEIEEREITTHKNQVNHNTNKTINNIKSEKEIHSRLAGDLKSSQKAFVRVLKAAVEKKKNNF